MGIAIEPEIVIDDRPPDAAPDVFGDCRNSAAVWMRALGCWRYVSAGIGAPIPLGLDWAQLYAILALAGTPTDADLVDDLQIMESAALTVLRKHHG
jgi:hypothetical protein